MATAIKLMATSNAELDLTPSSQDSLMVVHASPDTKINLLKPGVASLETRQTQWVEQLATEEEDMKTVNSDQEDNGMKRNEELSAPSKYDQVSPRLDSKNVNQDPKTIRELKKESEIVQDTKNDQDTKKSKSKEIQDTKNDQDTKKKSENIQDPKKITCPGPGQGLTCESGLRCARKMCHWQRCANCCVQAGTATECRQHKTAIVSRENGVRGKRDETVRTRDKSDSDSDKSKIEDEALSLQGIWNVVNQMKIVISEERRENKNEMKTILRRIDSLEGALKELKILVSKRMRDEDIEESRNKKNAVHSSILGRLNNLKEREKEKDNRKQEEKAVSVAARKTGDATVDEKRTYVDVLSRKGRDVDIDEKHCDGRIALERKSSNSNRAERKNSSEIDNIRVERKISSELDKRGELVQDSKNSPAESRQKERVDRVDYRKLCVVLIGTGLARLNKNRTIPQVDDIKMLIAEKWGRDYMSELKEIVVKSARLVHIVFSTERAREKFVLKHIQDLSASRLFVSRFLPKWLRKQPGGTNTYDRRTNTTKMDAVPPQMAAQQIPPPIPPPIPSMYYYNNYPALPPSPPVVLSDMVRREAERYLREILRIGTPWNDGVGRL